MLPFLRRDRTHQDRYSRLGVALAAERRLSLKRLQLLDVQSREIERLVAMNARLAALLIEERGAAGHPIDDALLVLLAQA
jgi:hypothetical protein